MELLLLMSLHLVILRFQRATIQTVTALSKKHEIFSMDLSSLTSFSSVVSIRISCD